MDDQLLDTDIISGASKASTISIIIPVFNGEDVIASTLESIVNQEVTAHEVFVVDDCSTDHTAKVCAAYPVTNIVLETNGGPAKARNVGVRQATGDIILFIDAGVVLRDPDTLKRLAKEFDDNPGIAGVAMIRDQDPLNDGLTPRYWAAIGYYQWMQPAKYHTSFATERSAIRRSVIENMDLFDEQYAAADVEDHEFGHRLSELGHKILIARELVTKDRFDTFKLSIPKMLMRSFMWMRLFLKGKTFDSVWNTKDRAYKTMFGALSLGFLGLSVLGFFTFPTVLKVCAYISALTAFIFLYYAGGFYTWLVKNGKVHLVVQFFILDILYSFIIALSASWSMLTYNYDRILGPSIGKSSPVSQTDIDKVS